jgi:hypothetical protein
MGISYAAHLDDLSQEQLLEGRTSYRQPQKSSPELIHRLTQKGVNAAININIYTIRPLT